jgi:UDP-N-acetylglucosamine 1-carboxyvinyltransferase
LRIEGVDALNGVTHHVLSDRIEAGTFLAAAAITRGDVVVENLRPEYLQTEIEKLREIGSEIECHDQSVHIHHSGDFSPVSIRTLPYPGFATDLQAQFMAVLCLARGESTVHETIFPDRFMHAAELNRLGANISVTAPSAIIGGVRELTGAHVMASDLRASAALVVAGLAAQGETVIHRIYHLDRGYERLEEKLQGLGAAIKRDKE